MNDGELAAFPLAFSFGGDSGSGVDTMNTAARTPFQSQMKSASVNSRKGVMSGSALRTVAIEEGVNSWLPATQVT